MDMEAVEESLVDLLIAQQSEQQERWRVCSECFLQDFLMGMEDDTMIMVIIRKIPLAFERDFYALIP